MAAVVPAVLLARAARKLGRQCCSECGGPLARGKCLGICRKGAR